MNEFFIEYDGNDIPSFENGVLVNHREKSKCFIRVIDEIDTPLIIICCSIKSTKTSGSITNHVEKISKIVFEKLNLTNKKKNDSIWIEHYPPGLGLAENGSYLLVKNPELSPEWSGGVNPRQLSELTGVPEEKFLVEENIYSK